MQRDKLQQENDALELELRKLTSTKITTTTIGVVQLLLQGLESLALELTHARARNLQVHHAESCVSARPLVSHRIRHACFHRRRTRCLRARSVSACRRCTRSSKPAHRGELLFRHSATMLISCIASRCRTPSASSATPRANVQGTGLPIAVARESRRSSIRRGSIFSLEALGSRDSAPCYA